MTNIILKKKESEGQRLIYQEGDVVLAKCEEAFPEPATIHSFRGYDAEQQEIYKVSFIGGGWAYLPYYYIQHLSFGNIRELCQKMKNHHSFVHRLLKAQALLKSMEKKLAGKCKQRFDLIYLSQQPVNMDFFGSGQILKKRGIESSMSFFRQGSQIFEEPVNKEDEKLLKMRQKFNRCKIVKFIDFSLVVTQQGQLLNIQSRMNNLISCYTEEMEDLNQTEVSSEHQEVKIVQKKKEEISVNLQSEETSVDQTQGQAMMEPELFKSIQKEMKENFETLQKYLGALKEKRGYEMIERYEEINGMSLLRIQNQVKEIFQILSEYALTTSQITLLFHSLSRFIYIFIEYHSASFLIHNLSKIKQYVSASKEKEKCMEKIPVLNIYELACKTLGEWTVLIDKQLQVKDETKGTKAMYSELSGNELLKKGIRDVQQKYASAMTLISKFM